MPRHHLMPPEPQVGGEKFHHLQLLVFHGQVDAKRLSYYLWDVSTESPPGTDLYRTTGFGGSTLFDAAVQGRRLQLIPKLLPHYDNEQGYVHKALIRSAYQGDLEVVQAILKAIGISQPYACGFFSDYVIEKTKTTPLLTALQNTEKGNETERERRDQIVRDLVNAGADLQRELRVAKQFGHEDAIYFLEKGIRNLAKRSGETADKAVNQPPPTPSPSPTRTIHAGSVARHSAQVFHVPVSAGGRVPNPKPYIQTKTAHPAPGTAIAPSAGALVPRGPSARV